MDRNAKLDCPSFPIALRYLSAMSKAQPIVLMASVVHSSIRGEQGKFWAPQGF